MSTGNWAVALALSGLVTLAACGEDPLDNPDDMVTINMMDENHGKTRMGTTDIYIDSSHNFKTTDYYLCDFGPVIDLGHIEDGSPDLGTLTDQAAVSPDEGYLAFNRNDCMVFPSGHPAVAIGASYYRIWVDEWIKENKVAVGARVNFALYRPEQYKLPDWNEAAGTIDAGNTSITVEVRNNKKRGCEAMLDTAARGVLTVTDITTNKKKCQFKISLTPIATPATATGRYMLYLRTGNSYTQTLVYVKQ